MKKILRLEIMNDMMNWVPVGASAPGQFGQLAMKNAVNFGIGFKNKRARLVDPDTNQVMDFYVG